KPCRRAAANDRLGNGAGVVARRSSTDDAMSPGEVRMRRSRWALICRGLVCLLLIALATMLVSSPAPVPVQADQTSAASLLELAQRYILRDGTGQVDLLAGQMPGDLPVALALPAGNRLIGSVVRRASARSVAWDIFFDIASTPADATAYFQRELEVTGWATP